MRKLIQLLLSSFCFCVLLLGCSSSKPSDPITEDTAAPAPAVENIKIVKDGETDYVIVRPEVDQYDPDYIVPSGSYTDNGSKLMIISDTEITDFSRAVVMKVIDAGMTPPSIGTTYRWTDMADWVLQ